MKDYKEKLSLIAITNNYNDTATNKNYSEMIKKDSKTSKQNTLTLLKNIYPNITGIESPSDRMYFELEDVTPLVPINIMGDGIRHLLHVITTVISSITLKDSYSFCIDEIENGLHYSAYRLLLKVLLDLAEKLDIQLFIPTHSLELLTHLKLLLAEENNAGKRNFVKIFSIAKTKKCGYKAYAYSYEGLNSAITNENEIRG
jgi:AAA15 family ATPase/GTPase